MNAATQWGLPDGFQPVRYSISDTVKAVLRGLLHPNEPVVISLANEGDTVTLVGTPERLFSVKTGTMGAGASGAAIREYPWEGIFDIKLGQAALNVKFAIHYRSSDGRTVETGRRAMLAKPAVDNLMPFESAGGQEAFNAMLQIWNYKRAAA